VGTAGGNWNVVGGGFHGVQKRHPGKPLGRGKKTSGGQGWRTISPRGSLGGGVLKNPKKLRRGVDGGGKKTVRKQKGKQQKQRGFFFLDLKLWGCVWVGFEEKKKKKRKPNQGENRPAFKKLRRPRFCFFCLAHTPRGKARTEPSRLRSRGSRPNTHARNGPRGHPGVG